VVEGNKHPGLDIGHARLADTCEKLGFGFVDPEPGLMLAVDVAAEDESGCDAADGAKKARVEGAF
jgi:hypothetical protein